MNNFFFIRQNEQTKFCCSCWAAGCSAAPAAAACFDVASIDA